MNKYVIGIILAVVTYVCCALLTPDNASDYEYIKGIIIPVIVFILIVFIGYVIEKYNSLVSLKNSVEDSWADIDVQLNLRIDLADNLVNIVKDYVSHENNTLVEVTKARSNLINATSVDEMASSSNVLNDSLKSLFALTEQYPDLKATDNFKQLQADFKEIELTIARYRESYNNSVKLYNTACETFPTVILAKLFKFKPALFFNKRVNSESTRKMTHDIQF